MLAVLCRLLSRGTYFSRQDSMNSETEMELMLYQDKVTRFTLGENINFRFPGAGSVV